MLNSTNSVHYATEDDKTRPSSFKLSLVQDLKLFSANATLLLTTVSVLVVACLWKLYANRVEARRILLKDFPPGPRSSFEFLKTFRHFFLSDSVDQLPPAEIYERAIGKIIGVSNSFARIVLISGFSELKEVFNSPFVTARPPVIHGHMYQDGKTRGLVLTSGEAWKEVRRFTVAVLRDYGMGQRSLEPVIAQEAEELVSILQTKVGRPFSTRHFFNLSAFNVLWQIISGQRFQMNDPIAHHLMDCIDRAASDWFSNVTLNLFPRMAHWPLIFWRRNPWYAYNRGFHKFCEAFIKSRVSDGVQDISKLHKTTNNDLANEFIEKVRSTTNVQSQFHGQLGYETLAETTRDLFVAATETTGTTMSWILFYLALHPEKQEKLHKEIDQILGGERPCLKAKLKMPYTHAVINEVLRISSNAPILLPHFSSRDVRIGKFIVPKDTLVLGNAYAIHHSKEIWGEPYVFRPERFLSEDESTLIKHEALIPFGIGKRVCPGEILAGQELFIFTTSIFQEFSITWNSDEPKPKMGAKIGLALGPVDHTLIATLREKK